MAARFTPERRGRLLGLLAGGQTMEQACADVGVSRATVTKWVARGRAGEPAAVEFATCLDVMRGSPGSTSPLAAREVVGLLEAQARKGSIKAMLLLLERPWEKAGANDEPDGSEGEQDPFAALEGDQLAERRTRRREA